MPTPSKYIWADRDLTALSDPRANPTRQIYKPRYARRAFGPPRFARNKQLKTLYTPGLKPLTFRFECQQANAPPPPHILSRGAVVKRLVCGTFALNITGEKFGLYPPVIFLDKKLDYSFKSEREHHSECSNFSFIPQLMYLIEYL